MKNTQKGFVIPLIIAIVAILVAGGAYVAYKNGKVGQGEQTNQASATSTTSAAMSSTTMYDNVHTNAINTWKTYIGSDFTVEYPSNLTPYSSVSGNLIFTSFAESSTSESTLNIILTRNSPVSADTYTSQFLDLSKKPGGTVVFQKGPSVIVDGLDANVVSDLPVKIGIGGTHIIFQKGNDMYEIVGSGDYGGGPVLQEFYSSFKFTN